MKDERKIFWEQDNITEEFQLKSPSAYITRCLDKLISNYPNLTVLDIGCGGGRYSLYLKERDIKVFAIDRHEKIASPIKKFNIPFIQAEMDNLPFDKDQFQMVLSIGVLHNALSKIEFEKAVFEISRVLKTGGFCICSVFTDDLISENLSQQKEDGLYLISGKLPLLLLSKQEINDIFKNHHFSLLEILDEHITSVVKGKRYVYSFLCQKQ